eukprot:CAMPEP_0202444202 /NCGR_PEP_ID=MMETSP1360-20130828/3352_1 /ASSEMBLY_ACC=CAM_ASM_000848 /TAXON_ID=515479 /ORGANISM="Licmophora paradoxa, Strain CCMP2313" /LENGTH=183 /DNA_ID=CAMNT_0049060145 /DNA_START=23 /DNA_END=574 /DNA_ORIENTATION=+
MTDFLHPNFRMTISNTNQPTNSFNPIQSNSIQFNPIQFNENTQEQQSLQKDPLEYCSVVPVGEDMYNWTAQLAGPINTPYQGGVFNLKIEFPSQYPFKPPSFVFATKVYHPSIETASGKICANVISEGWGPTLNVRHCLQVIYSMLQAPTADHPLEEEIAQQLRDNPKEFEKAAKKFTKDYAN